MTIEDKILEIQANMIRMASLIDRMAQSQKRIVEILDSLTTKLSYQQITK